MGLFFAGILWGMPQALITAGSLPRLPPAWLETSSNIPPQSSPRRFLQTADQCTG